MNKEFSHGKRWVASALFLVMSGVLAPLSSAQEVPVFQVTPAESTIKFGVKASVPIEGSFDQWKASLTFTSPDVTTAVFDVEIQAASVDTRQQLEEQQAQELGLLRRRQQSVDYLQVNQGCTDGSGHL